MPLTIAFGNESDQHATFQIIPLLHWAPLHTSENEYARVSGSQCNRTF